MRRIAFIFAIACTTLFADSSTKVGGSGKTQVGGSGKTKVGNISVGPIFSPVFSDNFDNALDASALYARTGWEFGVGTIYTYNPSGTAGAINPQNTNANSCTRATATYTDNQYAEFTFTAVGGTTIYLGPAVRAAAGADTFYTASYGHSAGTLDIVARVSGSQNNVVSTSKTYSVGNKLRIYVKGQSGAILIYVDEDTGGGWVSVFSAVYPGASYEINTGKPAVASYGNSTALRADLFVSGDYSP